MKPDSPTGLPAPGAACSMAVPLLILFSWLLGSHSGCFSLVPLVMMASVDRALITCHLLAHSMLTTAPANAHFTGREAE